MIKNNFIRELLVQLLSISLLSSLLAQSGFTASSTSLTVSHATGKPGEIVTVVISLNSNPGIAGFGLRVEYDSTRLRIESPASIKRETALGLLTYVGVNETSYSNNPLTVMWYGTTNDRSTGDVLTVTFTVLSNAPSGMAYVNAICGSNDIVNLHEERIPILITQGGINISSSGNPGTLLDTHPPTTEQPLSVTEPVSSAPSSSVLPSTPIVLPKESVKDIVVQFVDTATLPVNLQSVITGLPVFILQSDSTGKFVKASVPYALRTNETPDSLVAYHLDSSGTLSIVKLCQYDENLSEMKLIGSVGELYIIGEDRVNFADIAETAWYHRAVSYCATRKLLVGVGNNLFAPQLSTTRGMFITILARFDGVELSRYVDSQFTDVNIGAWYGPHIAWAMENGLLDGGILNGYEKNTFRPDDVMSREQLAVLIANYIRFKGFTITEADVSEFSDIKQASEWSRTDIQSMRVYGTLAGVGNNRFNPKGETTRAEMAQIFANLTKVLVS